MSNRRKLFVGTSISSGIVLGHARVVMPGDFEVAEVAVPASRLAGEAESLERAIEQTIEELKSLRESATRKMAGPVAKIFDAQLLIAGDYEFLKGVKRSIIQQKRNAAFVYNRSVQETTTPLKNSPDEYLQQMADDIEGVAKRVLSHLSGYGKCDLKLPTGTIIVGRSFSPGEILGYRERKAIGFVVAEGGRNSHSALIARALLLPMIVAKKAVTEIVPHSRVVVDGVAGEVIVNPSDDDWHNYQRSRKRLGSASITRIKKLTAIPPLTADGQAIQVGANLTLPGPADDLLASQAFPVGLYRTEFMYLQHDGFPDEEEQYQVYCQIAERFERSSVVIRTFDLGYDKFSRSEDWPEEDNPALGWRGLRAMLDMTPRFKTQVRAILRASQQGNLKIMLPMVSDVSEILRARKLISQVKLQLRREGIQFDTDIAVGIMVEVPSIAITAQFAATKVDFMSIGTNDLTQYTLAVDRVNNRVAGLYSALHPSVLSMIKMTIDAGRARNIPVSICGEIAGDLQAAPLFIGMGVQMLSVSPNKIFDLCRTIKTIDSKVARHLAASVLSCGSLRDATRIVQSFRTTQREERRYR